MSEEIRNKLKQAVIDGEAEQTGQGCDCQDSVIGACAFHDFSPFVTPIASQIRKSFRTRRRSFTVGFGFHANTKELSKVELEYVSTIHSVRYLVNGLN